jgi:hypothetical protein
VTLERRRKPAAKSDEPTESESTDKVKAESEKARKDASDRAAEMLARLRKL